ncbi:MAG: BMP family ABC transporter substrate-binding protein [Lachnospiraceae bacterium]|nr:BMP family ABC transporter substrate-binding protein [Lachnospiraceae bacterium]
MKQKISKEYCVREKYVITIVSAALVIAIFAICHLFVLDKRADEKAIKVGFVYIGDESNPYTYNFIRSQKALESKLGENVEILVKENVAEGTEETPIRELLKEGCSIIFSTSYGYGETVKKIAAEYPDVQFCQATGANANEEPVQKNYHTFMGHIYQGRYVSGVVAGMKIQEMIQEGVISKEEAQVGYVAAFPYAEVISGYTAFILGVRSVVPSAKMIVKYTNTWSDYRIEKIVAEELIEKKCVVISQHSDTIGPAVACEESKTETKVYHVGYNQSMLEVAPTTSLVSTRINWTPYIVSAVNAVLDGDTIEDRVQGTVNGNDVGAGFAENWVQVLELNVTAVAEGTEEKVEQVKKQFKDDNFVVFKGDYMGVDPFDETDTYNLNQGYKENEKMSAPTFHYVLNNIIEVLPE